jgi:RNA-directed DNA polymerase
MAQEALGAKTSAAPRRRRQRKAWRKAGRMEEEHLFPTTAGTPQGGRLSPLLALSAVHGRDEALTRVSPQAGVSTYADDGVVLHEDCKGLEDGQQRLMTWLAESGLTRNEAKSRRSHTVEGDQSGWEFLGLHIRHYRVGQHPSGKGPGGQARLGCNTLSNPAKANIQEPLAEIGRVIRRGKARPQGVLRRPLTPQIRGWATDSRPGVSHAPFGRLAHLTGATRRSWAHRRHPNTPASGVMKRYWHRLDTRWAVATASTAPDAVHLAPHREGGHDPAGQGYGPSQSL